MGFWSTNSTEEATDSMSPPNPLWVPGASPGSPRCRSNAFVEHLFNESGFSGAAYSCYDGHHSKRELHVYVFQVVFHCTFDLDEFLPLPTYGIVVNPACASKIVNGI